MTFASLYHCYTIALKSYIGKNLKTNLLVCEKDVSSNYIAKKYLDEYCQFIANQIILDKKLANKWAKDTVDTAEGLFETLAKIKTKKNLENLLELKLKFYEHVPPHFSMKKVVDYLPANLQVELTPKLAQARIKTENLFNAVDAALRSYTKFISKKSKLKPQLTEFLTIDEVQTYLRKNKLPSKSELLDRTKGTAIFYEGLNEKVLIGKEYQTLVSTLVKSNTKELKGTVAYQGLAKGIARIVLDPYKVKVFNKGDVLITGMTRPEFLPLMKKASAFVTDAGGMLSHAAIVARELKKPCILATESATKIFKDGDMVEVDANKGIVRKV